MLGVISSHDIERVHAAVDIIELISGYVHLKKAGKDHKALCPFHNEKTPSFTVSGSKQIFKCFGCGVGGNVFNFLMKHERVEFPEAVRMLAERAGITLTEQKGTATRQELGDKQRVYRVNKWASEVYHKILKDPKQAKEAREYLSRRKIESETIERFKIGYAPPAWDTLIGLAERKNISGDLLARAGLAVAREGSGGYYDRFRARVIFPIFDTQDRVVGFGGRVLDDSVPKYLNTAETELFNKSRCLFGLNLAKDAIIDRGEVAVVEGYTDVTMAHQHGVSWVVATLGTALTRDHLRILRRYADRVVLFFDADIAGQKASDRSLDLFVEEEIEARIAALPEGEDPCDFILRQGPEEFARVAENAPELIDFKIRSAQDASDQGSVQGKSVSIDAILQTVACSRNAVQRSLYIRRIAEMSGLDERSLTLRLQRIGQSRQRGRREERPVSGASGQIKPDATVEAQRGLIELMVHRSDLAARVEEEIGIDRFTDPALSGLAGRIFEIRQAGKEITEEGLLHSLVDDPVLSEEFVNLMSRGERASDYDKALADYIQFFKKQDVSEESRRLRQASQAKSKDELQKLVNEYADKVTKPYAEEKESAQRSKRRNKESLDGKA